MKKTGSTKERKARALAVLASGPWPVRLSWSIYHDHYRRLAQINAMRTIEGLAHEGLVDVYTDATGEQLWSLPMRAALHHLRTEGTS